MKIKLKIVSSLFFCGVFFISFSSFCQDENSDIMEMNKINIRKSVLDSDQQLILSKQIQELKARNESETKEQMIKLLAKDKEIQAKDLERQKTIRNYLAIGLLFFLVLIFFFVKKFLKEKKELENLKKDHEKNQKILDSFSK